MNGAASMPGSDEALSESNLVGTAGPVVVVGAGPAGLAAAWRLAAAGYKPLVL